MKPVAPVTSTGLMAAQTSGRGTRLDIAGVPAETTADAASQPTAPLSAPRGVGGAGPGSGALTPSRGTLAAPDAPPSLPERFVVLLP